MTARLVCSLLALPAAAALLVMPTVARLPLASASRTADPAMIFGDIMKAPSRCSGLPCGSTWLGLGQPWPRS